MRGEIDHILWVTALVATLWLGACSPGSQGYFTDRPISKATTLKVPKGVEYPNLPAIGDEIVASLMDNEQYKKTLREGLLLVTTFGNTEDLEKSSPFGRALQETIMSALVKRGIFVKEARASQRLDVVPKEGEFILSRSSEDLRGSVKAQFVLTGTFSETPLTVVVNARVLDFKTGATFLATSAEVIKTPMISALLKGGGKGMEPTVVDRLSP